MSIGIDLDDLGFDMDFNQNADDEIDMEPDVVDVDKDALVIGSAMAKALYSVWSGVPVTILDSPPGGGKTTLVAQLVATLIRRTDLGITVATPTRRGALDLAERIAQTVGDDKTVSLWMKDVGEPPKGVTLGGSGRVVVRTVASLKMSGPAGEKSCQLMIFDEAYQVTFADAANAADEADQVLMVGDPGQIGPVVTADMSVFRGMDIAPHMRAPEVFSSIEGAAIHHVEMTHRLGQATVDAIAPLYDFEFESVRPDRYLTDADGYAVNEITPFELPVSATFDNTATMVRIAEYAAGLIGTELIESFDNGTMTARLLTGNDIAVVVAHNAQASKVTSILESLNTVGVTVGTADRLQGGQWHAVVALDPLVGYSEAASHQLSPGRLCVMASRHLTHLTWMYEAGWEDALRYVTDDQEAAQKGLKVRRTLVER